MRSALHNKAGTNHKRHKMELTKGIKDSLFCAFCGPFCVTRLQLLVFGQSFRGSTFPSSQRSGVRDIKNNGSVPICRGRGGQFGTPPKASRTDHYYGFALSRSRFAPVCAAFVASQHFLDGASTPPLRGGEYNAFKFRPNGNIIDIWLRLRRAMPFESVFVPFVVRFPISCRKA